MKCNFDDGDVIFKNNKIEYVKDFIYFGRQLTDYGGMKKGAWKKNNTTQIISYD